VELTDIIKAPISKETLNTAKEWAIKLDKENQGKNTKDGGVDKNIKGCLGQMGVHAVLKKWRWPHEYSAPYQKELYGDDYDIKVGDEIWDVKCRGWWKEEFFYNISVIFSVHEEKNKCDHYIITTTDEEFENLYILGAISYNELWSSLSPVPKSWKMKFPAAGIVKSHQLTPFKKFVFRV
jgi:hypothetical protein